MSESVGIVLADWIFQIRTFKKVQINISLKLALHWESCNVKSVFGSIFLGDLDVHINFKKSLQNEAITARKLYQY